MKAVNLNWNRLKGTTCLNYVVPEFLLNLSSHCEFYPCPTTIKHVRIHVFDRYHGMTVGTKYTSWFLYGPKVDYCLTANSHVVARLTKKYSR